MLTDRRRSSCTLHAATLFLGVMLLTGTPALVHAQTFTERVQGFVCFWLPIVCPQEEELLPSPEPAAPAAQTPPQNNALQLADELNRAVAEGQQTPPPTITQPVIERVVETRVESGVSEGTLTSRLAALRDELLARIAGIETADPIVVSSSGGSSGGSSGNYVTQDQFIRQIDALGESLLSTSESFPTLNDENIPDDITVSNYLPLTGGSLSGDLTMSGTLTAGLLSVDGLASQGAIEAPWISATSTTATSTFTNLAASGVVDLATTTITGGLTVNGNTNITEGGQLEVGDKIISPGEIGLGTTTPAGKLSIQSTDPNQTSLLIVGTTSQSNPLLDVFDVGGTNLLRLTADGKLGIGTPTPTAKLQVNTTVGGADALVLRDETNSASARFYFTAPLGTPPDLNIHAGRVIFPGRIRTHQIESNSGLTLGSAAVLTIDGSGDGTYGVTSFDFFPDQNATKPVVLRNTRVTDDPTSTGFVLKTVNTLSDASAKFLNLDNGATNLMTVMASGNVGIGTTSPTNKLEVAGNTFLGGNLTATGTLSVAGASTFGGLLSLASTTIGDGTQAGGLTISGGATTTGDALVVGDISTAGDLIFCSSSPCGSASETDSIEKISTNLLGTSVRWRADGGTLSAPGWGFYDDVDTGLWDGDESNTISLVGGGVERLRADSSGNIGIGTSSPASKLDVWGDLRVGTSSTPTLFVDNAMSHVGIGTVSPKSALDLHGGTLSLHGSSGAEISATSGGTLTANSGGAGMVLQYAGNDRISISNDLELFSQASNNVLIGNGGSSALVVTGGNVGVGDDGPDSLLEVSASGGAKDLFMLSSNDGNDGNMFIVKNSGNVGIGTTTPGANLVINGTMGQDLFQIATSTNQSIFAVEETGTVSIGDEGGTGDAVFQYGNDDVAWAAGYQSSDDSFRIASSTELTTNVAMTIAKSGLVISGDFNDTSDARLKTSVKALATESGLEAVRKLRPISFEYTDPARRDGAQYGFIAQEVGGIFPTLVATTSPTELTPDGTLVLKYTGLIAPTVLAVQELDLNLSALASTTLELDLTGEEASSTASTTPEEAFASSFFRNLFARMTEWFADAGNGIQKMFVKELAAENVEAKRGSFDELCVGAVCVTEHQFLSVFSNQSAGQSTAARASIDQEDGEPTGDGGDDKGDDEEGDADEGSDEGSSEEPPAEEPQGEPELPAPTKGEQTEQIEVEQIEERAAAKESPVEEPSSGKEPAEEETTEEDSIKEETPAEEPTEEASEPEPEAALEPEPQE